MSCRNGTDPVVKRVRLIEHSPVPITVEVDAILETIKRASVVYAEALRTAVQSTDHDVGRLIAAMDKVHEAQRAATDSIMLYRMKE